MARGCTGSPGATHRSGWAQPWASKPPISGGNLQRGSPFLCALFFVLLKFGPPCGWPPPPAQPQKGAEARGVRNPDPAKKLHCGDRSDGAAHCLRCWTGRFLWSRWPQERGAQKPGHRTGSVDAAEGRGSRSDCKGRQQEKQKHCISLPILPGRERKLPQPRLQYLIGKHKESGLS